jgi:hypothetical protein
MKKSRRKSRRRRRRRRRRTKTINSSIMQLFRTNVEQIPKADSEMITKTKVGRIN